MSFARLGLGAFLALAGCASRYEHSATIEGMRIMEEGNQTVALERSGLVDPMKAPESREDRAPPVDIPAVLSLQDALRIATECNRDFKTQRESFFLVAQALGLTRRDFKEWVFTGSLSNNLTDGQEIELFESTALAFTGTRAVLPTGGSLTVTGTWTQFYEPESEHTVTGTATFSQPLLRGAGNAG